MPTGPWGEPESNFARFVREMSEASNRLEEYEREPERVMSEAGLSEEEKEIVRRGDEDEILSAIGWPVSSAAPLQLRILLRIRRRIPPKEPPRPS
jgi:hypothetical protein